MRGFIADGTTSGGRHILNIRRSSDARRDMYAGSAVVGNVGDTDAHLIIAEFDGAASRLMVDGTVENTGNAGSH